MRHEDVISANFGNDGVVIARRRSCMGLKQQHRKRDMKEKSSAESARALCTLERHKDTLRVHGTDEPWTIGTPPAAKRLLRLTTLPGRAGQRRHLENRGKPLAQRLALIEVPLATATGFPILRPAPSVSRAARTPCH